MARGPRRRGPVVPRLPPLLSPGGRRRPRREASLRSGRLGGGDREHLSARGRVMKKAILIALAMLAPFASAASAQTLEECLALARAHAPRLRVAGAGVSRAE